ncbi:MAG: phage portal protein [Henriciella sp.]|nr:phage portal protein [Henriciella sp.]
MKLPWSKPDVKNSESWIALSALPQASWGRTDPATLVREGYAGNAIVYRCARMIAEAAASIALQCSDEAAQNLLQEPSPDQSGQGLLKQLYIDLQVTGNAWAEAVTLTGETTPRGLFGLRADAVRVRLDDRGHVSGYAVKRKQGERLIGRERDGWSPVLHLKLYHPSGSAYGLAPLSAARRALDMHNGSAGWAKALIDNAARPSGALMYGKDGARLTDEQFDRLKEQLASEHSGAANAGRPLLLEGGLDWKPMSLSPAEMDFAETRHAAAREIALAFGVPPMLLGIPGDNTYATYKEAHSAFWRLTVLPLVQKTANALGVWLRGRFEDVAVTAQIDQVPAFAAERDAVWARVSASSFLSDEEKRAMLGVEAQT